MKRQFTATVYIVKEEKVLLLYHKKLLKWLPPGGHIEENELPSEAAKREALEETGLEITLIPDEHLWTEEANAISIPRPYMCLLENIPARLSEPAHQHIDFIYVGYPTGGSMKEVSSEHGGIRWYSFDELLKLTPEVDIFNETLKSIETIFQSVQV